MALAHITEHGFYVRSEEADTIDGEGTFTPLPEFDPKTQVPRYLGGQDWIVLPISARDDFQPPEPPEPPAPEAVTMRQAKIQLSRAGLLAKANAAIESMEGQAGEEARLEWEYATELRRDHPLVAGIGRALGLDDAAKDDLFRQAAAIA